MVGRATTRSLVELALQDKAMRAVSTPLTKKAAAAAAQELSAAMQRAATAALAALALQTALRVQPSPTPAVVAAVRRLDLLLAQPGALLLVQVPTAPFRAAVPRVTLAVVVAVVASTALAPQAERAGLAR